MNFFIIYDPDFKRTVPAVLIENRANIPEIRNQIGTVIKQYTDAQVAEVIGNVIPYKVISDLGVLVGYFTVKTDNMGQNGVKLQQVIIPAFQSFMEISGLINTFISGGLYLNDILV